MNDNRKIEIHRQPEGGFAVVVTGDELGEPYLSEHRTFDAAMTAALALQKAGEFAGAAIVDHTGGDGA